MGQCIHRHVRLHPLLARHLRGALGHREGQTGREGQVAGDFGPQEEPEGVAEAVVHHLGGRQHQHQDFRRVQGQRPA